MLNKIEMCFEPVKENLRNEIIDKNIIFVALVEKGTKKLFFAIYNRNLMQ